jgi:hypothetical protein
VLIKWVGSDSPTALQEHLMLLSRLYGKIISTTAGQHIKELLLYSADSRRDAFALLQEWKP